jgi:nanoRNase/pAp phosphatase (c-di-AMP/oligoRNAs hydrolase)
VSILSEEGSMKPEDLKAAFDAALAAYDDEVLILVTQMDPDAIGSAIALKTLLSQYGSQLSTIYYAGEVSHPQNQTLMNLLNLERVFGPIENLIEGLGDAGIPEGTPVALVDSSMIKDARLGAFAGKIDPIIVIDHHRSELMPADGKFIWIEDGVGSASTMMVELCELLASERFGDGDQQMLGDHSFFKDFPQVAQALAMGIYTDTHSLLAANERDRAAWGILMKYVKHNELKPFIDYPLSAQHFENLAYVLKNQRRDGAVMVASCGYMDLKDGDDLSTFADYLLRQNGVTEVYVWGIVGDKVRVSARSTNVSKPLDSHLRHIFGKFSGAKVSQDGRGEGGALMLLNLGDWSTPDTRDEVRALVTKFIESRVFARAPDNAG